MTPEERAARKQARQDRRDCRATVKAINAALKDEAKKAKG